MLSDEIFYVKLGVDKMDEKQTILTALEVSNLENMYIGDKARDARSKIRGFLFQDLLRIEKLCIYIFLQSRR